MNQHNVWLKSDLDKLESLIADAAKTQNMLLSIESTIRQLKAKNQFQLALLNQLRETYENDTSH